MYMKRIKTAIAALAIFTMAIQSQAQNNSFNPSVSTPTADEIIARHINAIGGKDNLEKIKNVVMEGSLTVNGADITVTVTQVRNKLVRQDITAMGMNGYDFTTDKEGWTYMPFQGMQKPEPKTPDDVKEGQPDLDLTGALYNYAAKGNKVEYLGTDDVEGTSCNKIKVILFTGREETYFLDAKTDMIVKTLQKRKVNGTEMEMSTTVSDYRDVEGVKMPFSITANFGTVTFSSIKVNQVIDDKLYKHE